VAVRDRDQAGRDRRRGAAGRAAGGPIGTPRVAGDRGLVVRGPPEPELGHPAGGHHDGTGAAESAYHLVVLLGDGLARRRGAVPATRPVPHTRTPPLVSTTISSTRAPGPRGDLPRFRCRPTTGRGQRVPPGVSRPCSRGSSDRGARSATRPRRGTRRGRTALP